MSRIPFALLSAVLLAACSQTHVAAQSPGSYASTKVKLDEQTCAKSAQYHGYKVLAPFHQDETDEKYKACMQRRGYTVTEGE